MVSSTTPRLAPRWPSLTDTISMINSRNSAASCGNCSGRSFLISLGYCMVSNNLPAIIIVERQIYNIMFGNGMWIFDLTPNPSPKERGETAFRCIKKYISYSTRSWLPSPLERGRGVRSIRIMFLFWHNNSIAH